MKHRAVSKLLFAWLFFSTALLADNRLANISVKNLDKNSFRVTIGDSELDVLIRDKVLLSKKDRLLDWVGYSAQAVHHYYGRFPVDKLLIKVEVTDGNRVRFGQAFGGHSPLVRVVVGEDITADVLRRDWIMVHEMVHLAMADMPRNQRWVLEGLATYVESIARAQLGHLSEDFVWNGFLGQMHQGLPASGDKGLDHTPTWGRTYWGGAMFCLLADVEIRKQSNNRLSLQDALRGILDAGYSMQSGVDNALQIFEAGDRATGLTVLVDLYNEMRAQPKPDKLDSLWKSLGLSLQDGNVVYDDSAELAAIRKQMLTP
ncbi:MAG: hypothetical protein HKN34_07365 [Gammaproteobacteria bacterium]|nr:hypothetical protein [Gammaproteobacteria bacterium]